MKPLRLTITAAIAAAVCMASCRHGQDTPAATVPALDTAALVMAVQQTSRLYTAEYRVHKIVTHADIRRLHTTILGRSYDMPLTLGDRKVAIPIDVTLRAYVDFASFSARQIEVSADGTVLHVLLPEPQVEVTASQIDHRATRQFVDLLRSDFTDAEMSALARQGEEAVMQAVPQMGIMETARRSATATLIPLFAAMGFDQDHVVLTFTAAPSGAPTRSPSSALVPTFSPGSEGR